MALKRNSRIYVNRSLNLKRIQVIGFDMDHTLAPYQHETFEALAFRKTLDKFIERGYPAALNSLVFDPNAVVRGLLIDKERGNLLKVDSHKYVKLAYHGKEKLAKEIRRSLYNSRSLKLENFVSVDSFFALSEVHLYIHLIDFMRLNPGVIKKSFHEVYTDLRSWMDESHSDGSIKDEVLRDIPKFIKKDLMLPKTLKGLKEGGKKLFLLTNSEFYYTDAVLSYLLNSKTEHWSDFFDFIGVSGRKPKFFTGNQAFVLEEGINLPTGKPVYSGGSAGAIQELLNVGADEVLYVGDHMYGDIISSKGVVAWRTMLIVEELQSELAKIEKSHALWRQTIQEVRNREKLEELYEAKKFHAKKGQEPPGGLEIKAEIERLSENIKNLIAKKEALFHPVWGEVMKVGLEKSRFAHQVERYACIYSSKVTNLRFYSAAKHFTSPFDLMPHDIEMI